MASIPTIGNAWRAQVRRKGHKSVAETFSTKAQAMQWARKIEAELDAKHVKDARGLTNLTLKQRIDRYAGGDRRRAMPGAGTGQSDPRAAERFPGHVAAGNRNVDGGTPQ